MNKPIWYFSLFILSWALITTSYKPLIKHLNMNNFLVYRVINTSHLSFVMVDVIWKLHKIWIQQYVISFLVRSKHNNKHNISLHLQPFSLSHHFTHTHSSYIILYIHTNHNFFFFFVDLKISNPHSISTKSFNSFTNSV